MVSAQAAPRRRARTPQETTAATDAHVQVMLCLSGQKVWNKERMQTPTLLTGIFFF
jgi:hypothetical protein